MKNVVDFPDTDTIEEEASRWIVKMEGDEHPSQQDIEELNAWTARSDMQFLDHAWVIQPVRKILHEQAQSMAKYPNIKPGQDFNGYP